MDFFLILSLAGGLLLLFAGAESLIRGASSIAFRFGISPLVVGLTVVAFGTSSPELLVSIKSSLDGNGDIAIGNVIGSNICNIALILGLSALIKPIAIQAQVIRKEIPIMIAVSLLLIIFLINQNVDRLEGIIFFSGIIIYTFFSIYLSKKENDPRVNNEFEEGINKVSKNLFVSILLVIFGLVFLILGANIFVNSAVTIAELMGVSQAVIGLTIVAIGTSIPELITSIVAVFKNESDIAIGNIVGSNIFNILSILGITAIITPIYSYGINPLDLIIMFITAVILFPISLTGLRLNRWEGGFLFGGYLAYMIYLIS